MRQVELSRLQGTPSDSLIQPFDAQRAEIEVRLRELDSQLQRVSGIPYSDHPNRPRGISARFLKKCYDNIRSHEGLLSLLGLFPVEILQRIFFFVTLSSSTGKNGWLYVNHNRKGLSVLCELLHRRHKCSSKLGWPRDQWLPHCPTVFDPQWPVPLAVTITSSWTKRWRCRRGR